MGRKLIKTVHVGGQVYGPGSDVPDEVAQLITNDKVWEDEQPVAKPAARPSRATKQKG